MSLLNILHLGWYNVTLRQPLSKRLDLSQGNLCRTRLVECRIKQNDDGRRHKQKRLSTLCCNDIRFLWHICHRLCLAPSGVTMGCRCDNANLDKCDRKLQPRSPVHLRYHPGPYCRFNHLPFRILLSRHRPTSSGCDILYIRRYPGPIQIRPNSLE